MPVACSETCPSGQAEAFKAPHTQMPWVVVPVPVALLLSVPLWLHRPPCSPTSTFAPGGLTLWPQIPAELGEGSAPEEVGMHAGPAPRPPPVPRAKGAQVLIRSKQLVCTVSA